MIIINHIFFDAIRQDLRKLGLTEDSAGIRPYGTWYNDINGAKNYSMRDHRRTIHILAKQYNERFGNTEDEQLIILLLGDFGKKYSYYTIDVLPDFEQSMHDIKYLISDWIVKHRRNYRKNQASVRQIEFAKKIIHDYPKQCLHSLSGRLQSRSYPPDK